jgi:hypothetical protein
MLKDGALNRGFGAMPAVLGTHFAALSPCAAAVRDRQLDDEFKPDRPCNGMRPCTASLAASRA